MTRFAPPSTNPLPRLTPVVDRSSPTSSPGPVTTASTESPGAATCSSPWSSSPPAGGSAPTTSTRACCASGSSSWATRSRTTSPTWSSPSSCSSTPRIPEKDISLYINSPGGVGQLRARDLRHDAVPARAGQHDLHRHGRVDGGGAAGGRRQGQALRPAEQPDHDPPGLRRVPRQRPGRRHPDEGMGVPGQSQHRDPGPPHRPADREGASGHRPGLLHGSRGCEGLWHHRRGLLGAVGFADRAAPRREGRGSDRSRRKPRSHRRAEALEERAGRTREPGPDT